MNLTRTYPSADYYMLADQDTMVFRAELARLLNLLEHEVLHPSEDLYTGHYCFEYVPVVALPVFLPFICTGGGVLLRGHTLRRAIREGSFEKVIEQQRTGNRCYWHADWVLGVALQMSGVQPKGHSAFQQFVYALPANACGNVSVACHKFDRTVQEGMVRSHRVSGPALTPEWAAPCEHVTSFHWVSSCDEAPLPNAPTVRWDYPPLPATESPPLSG